ncbi:MAG: sigma-70 family RNA polymerase sigma factor [Paludisphaera borealis]|uniref:sigma-70 family RNA polymerase sigma factor n=1 Tax=Paludisphaera borealis TaxID=1387353 RepID=UPI002850EB07|nr:sigma-70 family RNA polymerase sigma factor [Paludisphaera borealis]MDR3619024.1 sigma-70 family RNA polymerase sigma factor [Paludisphaera borealis]
MSTDRYQPDDLSSSVLLNRADVRVLTPEDERELLVDLDVCKKLLMEEYTRLQGSNDPKTGSDEELDILDVVRSLLADAKNPTAREQTLRSLATRYNQLRTRLAMANLRLVAHVARRYRDRGLSISDLLQEGFCGLLTAIDRYDTSNNTRLASYAVWWIRQALQRAVAAGAYPVRLNPRHLQKLAESSFEDEHPGAAPKRKRSQAAANTLKQIHSATRPAVSLNATPRTEGGISLLDTLSYPPQDEVEHLDLDEQVGSLIQQLKPREQVVLQLRFGLNGHECHSLSQVSHVLDVSKERIRQIQDAALAKLRTLAQQERIYCEAAG